MIAVLLMTVGCVTLIDVCPSEDDRYAPNIDPAETIEAQTAAGHNADEFVCEDGLDGDDHSLVTQRCCTSEWCVDGYRGTYCLSNSRFDAWAGRYCPDCDTDQDGPSQPRGKDEVLCSPQSIQLSDCSG